MGFKSLLVILASASLVQCHVKLTFPEARKYALDFLDNTRTTGPCGMEYTTGSPITTVTTGEVTVTWHNAYPHLGGVKFDILNAADGTVLHNLTSEYLYLDDVTNLNHNITLTADMACDHCVIRMIRQAGEWRLGNPAADSRGYIFWTCADVKIIASADNCYSGKCLNGGTCSEGKCTCDGTYTGDRCEYKNDCNTATDCGDNGQCVDTTSTYYPKKVCYCNSGYMGVNCEKESSISEAQLTTEEKKGFYNATLFSSPSYKFFYKVDGDDVEFAVEIETNTWGSIGFRPSNLDSTCRNFPVSHGTTPEGEGESSPETTPEAEVTAQPETTAAPTRRKRYAREFDTNNLRVKRATGTNVIKQLCQENKTAEALSWATWNYNGAQGGNTPAPEGEGSPTSAPEGETSAPEGETSAPEGEGGTTVAPEGEGETSAPEGEGEGGANLHPMDCTDIAFFAAIGNRHRIIDSYTRDRSTPEPDTFYGGSFSFTGAAAKMVDGVLYARFRRKLASTDQADHTHKDQDLNVIWARGQNPTNFYHWPASGLENCKATDYDYYRTNELKYHGTRDTQRGSYRLNLFVDPNATPGQSQTGLIASPKNCDTDCQYYGEWKYYKDTKQINITVTAQVQSGKWAAVGFSRTPTMIDSDAVMAWMSGNAPVFSDRWLSTKVPGTGQVADPAQDFVSTSAKYENSLFTMQFVRATNLKNSNDLDLEKECFYMLYAWGGDGGDTPTPHTSTDISDKICLESHGFVARLSSFVLLLSFVSWMLFNF